MDLQLLKDNKEYVIGTAATVGALSLLYSVRKWIRGAQCNSQAQLNGKVVIVTGANTGIGKETAIDLAGRGSTIIAACRNDEKGIQAVAEIRQKTKNPNVFYKKLDLASLKSVKEFATSFLKEYERLDILVNNAGVMMCPLSKTEDGFEMQFGTNHLGHFALTMLLLERLKACNPSRVVNLSSKGHRWAKGIDFDDLDRKKGYSSFDTYAQSKLANILFTRELGRRIKYNGVTTYAVHPGAVDTELQRHSLIFRLLSFFTYGMLTKTAKDGAQTSIYCAVQEGIEIKSGEYFADCAQARSTKPSYDQGAAKKLWEISEDMTGIKYSL